MSTTEDARSAPRTREDSCTDCCFDEDTATPMASNSTKSKENNEEKQAAVFSSSANIPTPAVHRFGSWVGDSYSSWKVGKRYRIVKILGQGSYGQVAEAWDNTTNSKVAIKCISGVFDQQIDTKRILREISILRYVRHENIIRLQNIIANTKEENFNDIYLVFDFVDTDLYKLINSPQYLTIDHVKTFMYQLLRAVEYLHANRVIHRDIKPANILLNEDCGLRLCDFGLARVMHFINEDSVNEEPPPTKRRRRSSVDSTSSGDGDTEKQSTPKKLVRTLTKHVVTRWYRPPELILLQDYSMHVDIWSIGCIFAELLGMQKGSIKSYKNRGPLFPGKSCFPLSADNDRTYKDRLDQLNVIFDVLGTPSEDDIAHLGEVKVYLRNLPKRTRMDFANAYKAAPPEAIDLLDKMLVFNPTKRISIEDAMNHPFLQSVRSTAASSVNVGSSEAPPPADISDLTAEELKAKLLEEISLFEGTSYDNAD